MRFTLLALFFSFTIRVLASVYAAPFEALYFYYAYRMEYDAVAADSTLTIDDMWLAPYCNPGDGSRRACNFNEFVHSVYDDLDGYTGAIDPDAYTRDTPLATIAEDLHNAGFQRVHLDPTSLVKDLTAYNTLYYKVIKKVTDSVQWSRSKGATADLDRAREAISGVYGERKADNMVGIVANNGDEIAKALGVDFETQTETSPLGREYEGIDFDTMEDNLMAKHGNDFVAVQEILDQATNLISEYESEDPDNHRGLIDAVKNHMDRAYGDGESDVEFDNTGNGPLNVPGFPLAVSIERSHDERFAHGFNDWSQDRLTAWEIAMISLINDITDKPGWSKDVFNNVKVGSWRAEALACTLMSPLAWDWCLLELQDMAKDADERGHICVLNTASRGGQVDFEHVIDSVGKGETARRQLLEPLTTAKRRENMRNHRRQWLNSWDTHTERFSNRFQWLPCEVDFSEANTHSDRCPDVKITSYINNLHPGAHKSLYSTIEKFISLSIQPWNDILAYHWAAGLNKIEKDITTEEYRDAKRKVEEYLNIPELPPALQLNMTSRVGLPTIEEDWEDLGLAWANIQSRRPPTDWRLNGMGNEHIVATSLVYFDSVNTTETSGAISFRVEADLDADAHVYTRRDLAPLAGIYGLADPGQLHSDSEEPNALQELGTIVALDGRLVAYPNTLQHRVEAYELLDRSRPGRRRCLTMHLVDPHYRICSTRNVPPQQHEWWVEEGPAKIDWAGHHVPQEIINRIMTEVGEWPMGMEEATRVRDEVIGEHLAGMEAVQDRVMRYQFD
ncbi:hypothetical protein K4K60_006926 [Colletotrichum sp. SAR11_57]|nr:hypothetical protein K4K60_006926 [Colletotrichum sp. SAR11_57]